MLSLLSKTGSPVPVRDIEIEYCRDRAAALATMIPRHEGHTCVDRPNMPCLLCDLQRMRVELSLAPSGTVLCRILVGDFEVESFSPGLYI